MGVFPRFLPQVLETITDLITLGVIKYLRSLNPTPVIKTVGPPAEAPPESAEKPPSKKGFDENILNDIAVGNYVEGYAKKTEVRPHRPHSDQLRLDSTIYSTMLGHCHLSVAAQGPKSTPMYLHR